MHQPPVTAKAVDGSPNRQARTMPLGSIGESQHDLHVAFGASNDQAPRFQITIGVDGVGRAV